MERDEAVAIYREGEAGCVGVLLGLASAVEAMRAEVEGLRGQVGTLASRVLELEGQVRSNSRNSSKPPSSDGLSKPPAKPRSLRRRSGRKPGGQSGHEGHHLAQVEVPDDVIAHEPERCEGCGGGLEGAELTGVERRQVFDLPPSSRRTHEIKRQIVFASKPTYGNWNVEQLWSRAGATHGNRAQDL